jgi:hypothetical protein
MIIKENIKFKVIFRWKNEELPILISQELNSEILLQMKD